MNSYRYKKYTVNSLENWIMLLQIILGTVIALGIVFFAASKLEAHHKASLIKEKRENAAELKIIQKKNLFLSSLAVKTLNDYYNENKTYPNKKDLMIFSPELRSANEVIDYYGSGLIYEVSSDHKSATIGAARNGSETLVTFKSNGEKVISCVDDGWDYSCSTVSKKLKKKLGNDYTILSSTK